MSTLYVGHLLISYILHRLPTALDSREQARSAMNQLVTDQTRLLRVHPRLLDPIYSITIS